MRERKGSFHYDSGIRISERIAMGKKGSQNVLGGQGETNGGGSKLQNLRKTQGERRKKEARTKT